jgi:putative transcriptional regulator
MSAHKHSTATVPGARRVHSPSLYLALRIAEYFEVPVEVVFATAPFPRLGAAEKTA